MDVVEIVTQKVREAVNVMSTQLPALIKVKLNEKADVSVVPTKVSDLTNDSGYQNAQQVEDKIDAKVSGVYRASDSASSVATLPTLTKANVGRVSNMLNDFTTTADFVEGAGKTFSAGTNVVVTDSVSGGYKYDVLAGFVDSSGKQDKLAVTGAATKGVYVSASGVVSPMTYELNANVPANFAPATAAPLMDGTAAVGTSAKYAHEDHRHPVDTSRASAADFAALRDFILRMESYCEASGNPATFSDAKAANIKALSVTITPTQSGSGDPSPTNIRPISGVSSVTVTRTGKNLFPVQSLSFTTKQPSMNFSPALPAGTYTLSAVVETPDTDSDVSLALFNNSRYVYLSRGTRVSKTFTLDAPVRDVVLYASENNAKSSGDTATWSNIQLEAGGAATLFELYQGQTVTVPLVDSGSNPLTVYGGTLDVTTGELTVTRKSFTLTGNMNRYSSEDTGTHYVFYTTALDTLEKNSTKQLLSDKAHVGADSTSAVCVAITGGSGAGLLYFRKDLLSEPTNSAANAWLTANPVQIVGLLASPATYQLAPAQLATLAGYNAVSSDAGPVDVTYKADASIVMGGDA